MHSVHSSAHHHNRACFMRKGCRNKASDRSAGDNDPEKPNTETDGGSSTDTTASPENGESISLSSTAEDSSLSVSEQSPDQSSAADSTAPSSEAKADSSKPADPLSDPDAGTGSEMDHKASRTRSTIRLPLRLPPHGQPPHHRPQIPLIPVQTNRKTRKKRRKRAKRETGSVPLWAAAAFKKPQV